MCRLFKKSALAETLWSIEVNYLRSVGTTSSVLVDAEYNKIFVIFNNAIKNYKY